MRGGGDFRVNHHLEQSVQRDISRHRRNFVGPRFGAADDDDDDEAKRKESSTIRSAISALSGGTSSERSNQIRSAISALSGRRTASPGPCGPPVLPGEAPRDVVRQGLSRPLRPLEPPGGPPSSKQPRLSPPPAPPFPPSAVEGPGGMFWLEVAHDAHTTVNRLMGSFGEDDVQKIVGSLNAGESAFLAYQTRNRAQHALDRTLSDSPGTRLRPVGVVPLSALNFVISDRSASGALGPFGAPGRRDYGGYKVVFKNFPENMTQIAFARDLIKNGFSVFDKSSLLADNG